MPARWIRLSQYVGISTSIRPMPFIGEGHWYIILGLIVLLIVFGPGKLPEVGGAVGKMVREFRRAGDDHAPAQTPAQPDQPPSVIIPAPAAPTQTSVEAGSEAGRTEDAPPQH